VGGGEGQRDTLSGAFLMMFRGGPGCSLLNLCLARRCCLARLGGGIVVRGRGVESGVEVDRRSKIEKPKNTKDSLASSYMWIFFFNHDKDVRFSVLTRKSQTILRTKMKYCTSV
jgi:hypothetical protein